MNVNRSGYYKWKKRKDYLNRYQKDRRLLTELLNKVHLEHKSYGYHRLARIIKQETGWIFSDNLAHKCCKEASIKSEVRSGYKYRKPGEEHLRFANKVNGQWHAKRPLEIVVSDMTIIKHRGIPYEWTFFLDTFDNSIIKAAFPSEGEIGHLIISV